MGIHFFSDLTDPNIYNGLSYRARLFPGWLTIEKLEVNPSGNGRPAEVFSLKESSKETQERGHCPQTLYFPIVPRGTSWQPVYLHIYT